MSTTADMELLIVSQHSSIVFESRKRERERKMCAMCIAHNTKAHIQNRFQTAEIQSLFILLDEELLLWIRLHFIWIYSVCMRLYSSTYLIKFQSSNHVPLDWDEKKYYCVHSSSILSHYLRSQAFKQQTHVWNKKNRRDHRAIRLKWNTFLIRKCMHR